MSKLTSQVLLHFVDTPAETHQVRDRIAFLADCATGRATVRFGHETETAYDRAARVFQDEGLTLPEVPQPLKPELRQISDTAFATRELPWSLYDIPLAVAELTSGQRVVP